MKMLFKSNNGKSGAGTTAFGGLDLEVDEAYIVDRTKTVARLDKNSMKSLRVSAGDPVLIFAGDKPVIAKVFPFYPSDSSTGVIRISQSIRNRLKCDIGASVTVRGLGNTKIDKVISYLLLESVGRDDSRHV